MRDKLSSEAASFPLNTPALIGTELVRWSVVVAVIYLSVWQYCSVAGYTEFVPGGSPLGVAEQFWAVFSAIMAGLSLVVYLPWRILSIRLRHTFNIIRDERWLVSEDKLHPATQG